MTSQPREEIPLTKLLEAILPYQVSIYVTVLNIIQCITLAFLINEVRVVSQSEGMSLHYALRATAVLALILVIWHRYISESQYLWPMSWLDTIGPFSMGIIECTVVFSTNEKVPLHWFIGSMMGIQCIATISYSSAYFERRRPILEKLYSEIYADYPEFTKELTRFLKDYDRWHIRVFAISAVLSFMFFLITFVFSTYWLEIFIPGFYLAQLVWGDIANNFQKALREDEFIGHHFK